MTNDFLLSVVDLTGYTSATEVFQPEIRTSITVKKTKRLTSDTKTDETKPSYFSELSEFLQFWLKIENFL